jgi:hypothetical protein
MKLLALFMLLCIFFVIMTNRKEGMVNSSQIIIKNRYFGKYINSFFSKNKFDNGDIFCDIDILNQYSNNKNCSIINHIKNYKIYGDKTINYKLLTKYNKNTKYVLETHLFDTNNVRKIKDVIHKYPMWIIKPTHSFHQKGITIIKNYNEIKNWINKYNTQKWVLQKYISNPFLVNNKKFNLRIYVVINKNKNNIDCFIYNKGVLYTSIKDYNLKSNNLKRHLSGSGKDGQIIFDNNIPLYNKIWYKMKDLVINCIVPIIPLVECPNDNDRCYKLLGVDILVDDNYNIFLCEVNARLIGCPAHAQQQFKDLFYNMYTDILNEVYFGKSNGLDLAYSTKTINYFIKNYKWF